MRNTMLPIVGAILLFGCGAELPAETRLAGAIQQFQKSAGEFSESRRAIVQERQRAIAETEEAAARTRAETERMIGLWRLADDNDRIKLYERLVASAKAAGDAAEALDRLRDEHDAAIAQADTKVKVREEKLTAAIEALTSLGTAKKPKDALKFYIGFAQDTMNDIQRLQDEAKGASKKP